MQELKQKKEYFFVVMAKKNSKKSRQRRLEYGNIFPLAILLLAGCSPAEPTSSWDSIAKINIFEKNEKFF